MRRNYFFSRNRDALLEPCDGKLSRTVLRGESPRKGADLLDTSQFSDMKIRRLTRKYGFGGYSIYRYLVNEALHKGDYFLPWCEETARETASYWNASLEDITRIVKGCIQVGLFNGELYRRHRVLTSEDIQQNYLKTCCMLSRLPDISEELELAVS